MYKSKLQELCQKQKWALPEYMCIRDGEDHRPLFNASVVVRGVTFNSPTACKSSKQAHNEAAQLAFLHFTSALSNQGNEKEVRSSIDSEDMTVKQSENLDECIEFKKKLQMYAQKKNLKPPVYCNEEEGTMFRAKVSVDEDLFQSPTLCETIEEAQNSAAQTALLSLSTENNPQSYKTLLHDLAKNEGLFLPMYTTVRSDDESKCQTFVSTVDVEGEVFQGVMAKSKKLAELNAAKAAYTVLIERKLFQPGYFLARSSSGDDILKLAPRLGSVIISAPEENPKIESQSNFSSSTKHESPVQETIGEIDEIRDKVKEITEADYSKKKTTETLRSYLLCNRVKVFTSIPNMSLPKDTVLLPISENMWTMVTLEFPSEKGT